MQWIKKGLLFHNQGQLPWSRDSALTPTPVLLEDRIRVYAGMRDGEGISRIGFIDLDRAAPSRIIGWSEAPVLDIGTPGAFDDNGVILGDVVQSPDGLRMYYVGFQLVRRVKFLAFTGLAVSTDGGLSFRRRSDAPVLDRAGGQLYIRAVHTALWDEGKWKIWYASGNRWEMIDGKPYPSYHIWYTESADGIHFSEPGHLCVDLQGEEYRIGRPRVYKRDGRYIMFYTKGTPSGSYLPGVAYSDDGKQWLRQDDRLGIALSEKGWDAETLCYPSLVFDNEVTYMFYNGNKMGAEGFGYALLDGDLWS